MTYLLTQIFLYMLGAFMLGLFLGWLLWGRQRGRSTDLEAENARLREARDRLKAELEGSDRVLADMERRIADLKVLPAGSGEPSSPPEIPAPAPLVALPQDAMDIEATSAEIPAVEPDLPTPVAKTISVPRKTPKSKRPATQDKPDDLRRMVGIGPVNERLLNEVGVTSFAQIAAWTSEDVQRIEERLEFDGRIERERWVEQAKLLAAGEEKEFQRRFPMALAGSNS